MSDWFDKITEEDIGTEDVSCGLEEMGVPADDSLDAYDVFYAKECNLPVAIDFIFTYKSTIPDDYDVLRSMKYEMRTSPLPIKSRSEIASNTVTFSSFFTVAGIDLIGFWSFRLPIKTTLSRFCGTP